MVEAYILKKTKIPDGMGGYEDEWMYNETTEGYLDQLQGDEVLATEKLGELADSIFITFDTSIDINRQDRVNIGGTIKDDNTVTGGQNYDVRNVDDPLHVGHHLEITLRYTE